jgi:iron complex outermembrane recepter protein
MKHQLFALRQRAASALVISASALVLLLGPAPVGAQEEPEDEAPAPSPETVDVVPLPAAEEPAPAAGSTKLDTIEVTGSRLRRTDYETAQPVLVLSREDIERTGLTDISEILRNISAAGNSSLSAQQARFAQTLGETNLDLRNLGAQHTLLLVNGKRWVTGLIPTQPSVSDYNTIPTAIIERIEVLKDGASAIYGSDAIGGVVNIITRKDFAGWGATYQAGQYIEQGDGFNQQASLSWGTASSERSIFVNFSFTDQDLVPNENRELTDRPDLSPSRDSIVTTRGLIRFVAAGTNPHVPRYGCPNLAGGIVGGALGEPTTGGPITTIVTQVPAGLHLCDLTLNLGADGGDLEDYHQINRATPTDVYNRFAEGTLKEPSERTAFYTQMSQKLFAGIDLGVEALYNLRRSTQIGQNLYLGAGNLGNPGDGHLGYIPADHPMNPFGQDIGRDASCPDPNQNCTELGPNSGAWAIRRARGLNNWLFIDTVDTMRLGASLRGDFDLFGEGVFWDGGYVHSRNKIEEISPLVRYDRAGLALQEAECANTPGCVFLNPFSGAEGLTQEMVDYIVHDTYQRNKNQQDIAYLNVSTQFPQWNFLAGPLAMAAGLEMRTEQYTSIIDPVVRRGLTFLNSGSNTEGETEAREAYLEFGIPLLRDVPGFQSLDLDIAGRASEYPGIADVTTGKAGLRWQPLDDLLLRGTYSHGFRAPNVGELYIGPSVSFDPLIDPCANNTDTTTQLNCLQDGAPGGGQGGNLQQPYDLWQGNPDLKPEKSKNITYGLVYSPNWLPDFNFSLDYYDIEIEDFITIGLGQYFLDSCYTQEQRAYCEYIHRSGDGSLVYIDTPWFNHSSVRTKGVDGGMEYVLPLPEVLGRFKLSLDASYLQQYDIAAPQPGGRPDQVTGQVGTVGGQFAGYPRWKAGGVLGWSWNRVKASWSTRMAYHLVEQCNDPFLPTLRDLGVCNRVIEGKSDDPTTPDTDESTPDVVENKLPTIFYHHLQLGYELTQYNAELTFGVNNILDQDPPISRSLTAVYWYNYDPNHYDVPGRFGYFRVNFRF